MEIEIFKDYEILSAATADMIIKLVQEKPAAVLCLATGDTPKLTYKLLAEKAKTDKVDFKNCIFIGLDEWVGISPANPGSCHWFLHHYLFEPMSISTSQIILFDAMAKNPDEECEKMNKAIEQIGGIDLMLVGIGMNGHIGFNEPGASRENYAHVAKLAPTTLSIGKKYFNGSMDTDKGMTLGLKHFMDAKKVIMMANGEKKSAIIEETLKAEINTDVPSTLMRKHGNAVLLLDQQAAGEPGVATI